MSLLLFATAGLAADIVVVLASREPPYQAAANAIISTVTRAGHRGRIETLESVRANTSVLVENGDTVFAAVGTAAAILVSETAIPPYNLTYCMVSDARELAFPPGCGVAGVSIEIDLARQFTLIAEGLPHTRDLGMLYRSEDPDSMATLAAVRAAIPSHWTLNAVDVDDERSLAGAIKRLFRLRNDIVWTEADRSIYSPAVTRSLLLESLRRRTPVFGFSQSFVRAGALIGVGIDPTEQGKQAGEAALELLRDAVSSRGEGGHARIAPRFQIAVNLIAAEKFGYHLPESLIKRADYVISPKDDR